MTFRILTTTYRSTLAFHTKEFTTFDECHTGKERIGMILGKDRWAGMDVAQSQYEFPSGGIQSSMILYQSI